MKFRNSWRSHKPNWKALTLRVRVSLVDVLSVEFDPARNFYALTVLNFTFKNR